MENFLQNVNQYILDGMSDNRIQSICQHLPVFIEEPIGAFLQSFVTIEEVGEMRFQTIQFKVNSYICDVVKRVTTFLV